MRTVTGSEYPRGRAETVAVTGVAFVAGGREGTMALGPPVPFANSAMASSAKTRTRSHHHDRGRDRGGGVTR